MVCSHSPTRHRHDTDKKWVIKNCVQVFIVPDTYIDTNTDTDTDVIGLQAHFVSVSVCISVGQCEHTIKVTPLDGYLEFKVR